MTELISGEGEIAGNGGAETSAEGEGVAAAARGGREVTDADVGGGAGAEGGREGGAARAGTA